MQWNEFKFIQIYTVLQMISRVRCNEPWSVMICNLNMVKHWRAVQQFHSYIMKCVFIWHIIEIIMSPKETNYLGHIAIDTVIIDLPKMTLGLFLLYCTKKFYFVQSFSLSATFWLMKNLLDVAKLSAIPITILKSL